MRKLPLLCPTYRSLSILHLFLKTILSFAFWHSLAFCTTSFICCCKIRDDTFTQFLCTIAFHFLMKYSLMAKISCEEDWRSSRKSMPNCEPTSTASLWTSWKTILNYLRSNPIEETKNSNICKRQDPHKLHAKCKTRDCHLLFFW